VGVHDVGLALAQLAREARHERRIETAVLRHPPDGDPGLDELGRHRPSGAGASDSTLTS